MKDTVENCVDCGEKYVKRHPNQTRCKECQRKHDKELHSEAGKRHRKIKYAPIIKDPHICKKTKTCVYGGKMGGTNICDFYEKTGTRRPCPVEDCTMYKRRSRRKEAAECQ